MNALPHLAEQPGHLIHGRGETLHIAAVPDPQVPGASAILRIDEDLESD